MAQRALDIAKAYTSEREGFDSTLSDKQSLRHRIADAEAKLHMARTGIRDAADRIAAGDEARIPVSMCKVFTANATQDAVDLAVQCCGANGIGKDLPLSDFYESVRQFRIVDGADRGGPPSRHRSGCLRGRSRGGTRATDSLWRSNRERGLSTDGSLAAVGFRL